MKKKTNNLSVILRLIAALSVIPLIFSSFSSGYNVVAEKITSVSMFEFAKQGNILLTQAFIFMVLQVIVILFLIFFTIVETTKRKYDRMIGVFLAVAQFVISILSLACVIIFCITNEQKCTIGISPIFYLIFGAIYCGLMVASYFVGEKKRKNAQKPTGKSEMKPQVSEKE